MRHSPMPAFAITFGLSPYAHEHEPDEDALDRETHDVSEHDEGELHLPRLNSKAEVRRHVECLKAELAYYEAMLAGDERAASKAREQLFHVMGDGEDDGQ